MYTVEAVFSFDKIEPQYATEVNPWVFVASLEVAEEVYFSFITAPEGKVLGRTLTSVTVRDMRGNIRHHWEGGMATYYKGIQRDAYMPYFDQGVNREACRVLEKPEKG